METLEEIDNLSLIENDLLHLQFELSRKTPSYFRIAREAHLLLYRSMIEALKSSANLPVTRRPRKNPSYRYHIGQEAWQEIHKIPIAGCQKAWRFSKPEPCEKPRIVEAAKASRKSQPDDYLIGFYHALAMIQTQCFMKRLLHSNVVPVSDADMKTLEWLHERIRNEYEHFVPKYYLATVKELAAPAELSIHLSRTLLYNSGNVIFHTVRENKLMGLFQQVVGQLEPEK